MLEKIAIFGAGGHAKVAIDIIQHQKNYVLDCIVDDNPLGKGRIAGCPLVGSRETLLERQGTIAKVFIAIGDNKARREVSEWVMAQGFSLCSLHHDASVVASSVTIGEGCLIMPGSVINANAVIGNNVIINTGAIVEHDCQVGNHAHIAPRATLCGAVCIGNDTLVGAGAIILPGVRVGIRATVGAGAVVLSDVPDDSIAMGIPARIR